MEGQTIHTKHFGDLHFVRTWARQNDVHLGRLTNGTYAHIGGLPVGSRDELQRAIPSGEDLQEALNWFDNRDARAAEAMKTPARLVFYYPGDQSWRYIDTNQPVDSVEDLYEALKGSTALNGAIGWFVEYQRKGGHQQDANAPAGGIDDRILQCLGGAQLQGMTAHELATTLAVAVSELIPILRSMDEGARITHKQKHFFLPEYATVGSA